MSVRMSVRKWEFALHTSSLYHPRPPPCFSLSSYASPSSSPPPSPFVATRARSEWVWRWRCVPRCTVGNIRVLPALLYITSECCGHLEIKMHFFLNAVFPLCMHELHEDWRWYYSFIILCTAVEDARGCTRSRHVLEASVSLCCPLQDENRIAELWAASNTVVLVNPTGFCQIRASENQIGDWMFSGEYLSETIDLPALLEKKKKKLFLFPQESQDYEPEA